MSIRRSAAVAGQTLVFFALFTGLAAAQTLPPQRMQRDSEQDDAMDCFECSRGDLLTFDLRTGELIRRTPPEAVPRDLRLLSEGGQGARVRPGAPDSRKDFGYLSEVHNTTVWEYPKHVKIYSWYTNEHGESVSSGCSGTMIDPTHVLTAGHCIYMHEDGDGNEVNDWAHTVRVIPGFDDGLEPFGRAEAVQLHSWAGWTSSEDYDWDVAIIDLDWPIGATTGWRPYGSRSDCGWFTSGFWEHFGYPADDFSNGKIMFTQSGQFDGCESSGNEVWFDREMYKGQSGGGCVREGTVWTVRSNHTLVGIDDWDTFDVHITGTMWNDITSFIAADTPSEADLIPLEIIVTEDPVRGEFFSFDLLVHNYSSAANTGGWSIVVYGSTDDVIDPDDEIIGYVSTGTSVGPKQTVDLHVGVNLDCYVSGANTRLGVRLLIPDANPFNNWTMPRHAAPIAIQSQPLPPQPVPSSPPHLSQCRSTEDLVIMWSDTAPLGEYEVVVGTSPGIGPVYSTTINSITVSDLQPSTWYYWRVRAGLECSGWSAWTDDSRFYTMPDPHAVAAVVAPPDSIHCVDTNPTLDWTSLVGAESYDVRISPVWCYEGVEYTAIPITQLALSGLTPNTTYYWAVRAHDYCSQTTDWSSDGRFCYTFKTAATSVEPPVLTLPADGSTCANPQTLLFFPHVVDADHYEVQVGETCGSGTVYETVGNGVTPVGLESGVVYHWRARAFHECGPVSDWTPCWSFSLNLDPPLNPTTLESTSHTVGVWSTDNTIDTSWDFGYDTCEGSWVHYGWVFDNQPDTEPIEQTSEIAEFTFTTSDALADGDDHWFHLRSVDMAGNWAVETMHLGPFLVDANPPSTPVITRVSVPVGRPGDYRTLGVEWDPSTDAGSGVAGYSHLLDDPAGPGPDGTVDTTVLGASFNLPLGTRTFRIAAVDGIGHASPVAEAGPIINDTFLPAFLVPAAGQIVSEYEALAIQWEAVAWANGGSLHLSLDGGQTFTQIATLSAAELEAGLYPWTGPAESTDEAVLMLNVDGLTGPYTACSSKFSLRMVSGIGDGPVMGAGPHLANIYPNPFNARTTVVYTLDAADQVRLTVLNALGHCVCTLVDRKPKNPGRHEAYWDGTDRRGLRVASGVYFACLETAAGRELRRMVLVK